MPRKPATRITPEHLVGVAKHVEEFAADMRAFASTMRGEGVTEFSVTAWSQTEKAVGFLDAFYAAMRDAMLLTRQERGEIPKAPPPQSRKNGVPDSPDKRPDK